MTQDVQEQVEDIDNEETEAPEAVEEAETTAEAEPEAVETPQWSDEDVSEAKMFGWKAPDEWEGAKPAGYIDDPTEYLGMIKRSRTFKTMDDKIRQMEQAQEEITGRLERMNQKALERQREQYEGRIEEIRKRRDAAAEDGDMDAYKDLAKQEREMLKKPVEAEPEPQQSEVPPEIKEYMDSDQGAWMKNPVMVEQGAKIIGASPEALRMPPKQQVEYAEGVLRTMYPAAFPGEDKPAKPKPRQVVDGGGLASGVGAAKGGAFNKLPSDAKTQFKRFVADGIYKDNEADRKEYADEYFAQ